MRGAGGLLAMGVAVLLVCCSADPHQEQDTSVSEHSAGERYDANGHKNPIPIPNPLSGGNMVREVRDIRRSGFMPYFTARGLNYASPYGGKRESIWPGRQADGYYGDGLPKRNFDEIDRSGLDTFVQKRNFDEIDRSSMPFPYATKRFYHLPIDGKKRYRPDYPMDEIDLSNFPIGFKRSLDTNFLPNDDQKRDRPESPMDEIDLSGFPIGSKRSLDIAFGPHVQ